MKAEIRADKKRMTIEGYVNVADRNSRTLMGPRGPFVERISPGTFGQAIRNAQSVRLMYNHQRDLGGTDDGNLDVFEDNIGLYARADVTDPEVIEEAVQGHLRGWSFGFLPLADVWEDGDPPHRCINELELREVSILTLTPAYIATSIEARGEDVVAVEYRQAGEEMEVTMLEPVQEERAEEPEEPPEDTNNYSLSLSKLKLELEKERY